MSKNFELMQKAGKGGVFRTGIVAEVTMPIGNGHTRERSAARGVTALDLNAPDYLTAEEIPAEVKAGKPILRKIKSKASLPTSLIKSWRGKSRPSMIRCVF